MPRPQYTDAQREQAIRLIAEPQSRAIPSAEIARLCGVSAPTVRRWRRELDQHDGPVQRIVRRRDGTEHTRTFASSPSTQHVSHWKAGNRQLAAEVSRLRVELARAEAMIRAFRSGCDNGDDLNAAEDRIGALERDNAELRRRLSQSGSRRNYTNRATPAAIGALLRAILPADAAVSLMAGDTARISAKILLEDDEAHTLRLTWIDNDDDDED